MNNRKEWSKLLSLMLVFVLLISTILSGLSVSANVLEDENVTLKVVHTNDIHASIDDFGKIAAYIESESANSKNFLFLDAGDIFSGNPVVDLQYGQPIIELLNLMRLDALAIGNHEFDYGQAEFAARVKESTFPWLSANMRIIDSNVPIEQPEPYKIFNMDGFTVGIVALTEAPPSTAPANVVGIEFDPYVETAQKYEFLRNEVDVLIALNHIGYGEDRKFAEAVTFFDVIIGAHSHTTLAAPVYVNGTPIVQTGGNATNVGNLTIEINKNTKEVVSVNGFLQKVAELTEVDEEVQAKVDQYNEEMEEVLGKVIGFSNTGLSRDGRTNRDVPLGNFWTDAMRNLFNADIALTNNGGIRDSIPSGDITAKHIYTVEPFANEIMEIRMTGQAIKDVIEYSYSRRNQIDLQTSGLTYEIITYDSGNFYDAILKVNGEAIDLTKEYSVAVADYIGTGGSGYNFVGEVIQPAAGFMTNAMVTYAEMLTAEGKALDYTSEGRIKVTKSTSLPPEGDIIGSTSNGLLSINKAISDAGLGNLHTDAVRAKTSADIALINNSSVLGDIASGDITDKQIEALDPYKNEIVVVRALGSKIKEVILGQSNFHKGVDLQASGITYKLIEADGTNTFNDVQIFLLNGTALDLNAMYTVAYNDYMHGRGFYQLSDDLVEGDFGKVWEATVEYVRNHQGPIDYVEGQRISIHLKNPGTDPGEPSLPEAVEDLKLKIEEAQFRNQGNKVAIFNHLRNAEKHFEKATEELQKGNIENAEQQQKLGYDALQRVRRDIEKQPDQVLGAEEKETLVKMIEAIIAQMKIE